MCNLCNCCRVRCQSLLIISICYVLRKLTRSKYLRLLQSNLFLSKIFYIAYISCLETERHVNFVQMLKYQKLGGWSKFERICFILPRIPLIVILSDRQKMLKIWRKSPTLIRGPCLVLLLLILTLKYAGIMYTP